MVRRNEIYEILKDDESLYYKIEIEKWCKFKIKIEILKFLIRSFIYIIFYFFNNVDSVIELCIKIKEEFRLFLEFKRFCNEIYVECDKNINVESRIKVFKINDINIVINNESIMSVLGNEVVNVFLKEFLIGFMKSIKRFLSKNII